MEKVDCFIRKNTPKLRKRIEDLGVEICCCASFKSSIWLDYDSKLTKMIHGAPLYDGDEKQGIICFLKAMCDRGSIDCGENEEMFLALIALRNDTDKNQWFVADSPNIIENYALWFKCPYDNIKYVKYSAYIQARYTYHKATAQEIVEHFKTK